MKCPLCQVEMRISKSRNIVEIIDDTPHLYLELDLTCYNKNCENYEKVVDTRRDELPIG